MGSSVLLFAITSVALFLIGLWFGLRLGRTGLQVALDEAKDELRELRPKAETLAAVKQQLQDEQDKYAQMKSDLDAAFKGAAADALRANTQSFLALARQELGGQTQDAKQSLDAREKAIQGLLKPLEDKLNQLDFQTQAMETARAGAYSEIKVLVETIQNSIPASLDALKTETSQLVSALRAPKTRGNWGELQLKRCVEFAGMVEYCSFAQQISARDAENNLLRPDMTIQLPNGRSIIVDAKTPLDAFLDADDRADVSAQAMRFAAHAERVKAHLRELSSKGYWKQFEHTPEFVVCFLPSEALFSAALEADPSLIEFGSQSNVVLATPTTLIALLKAVAYGWQQSKITENAKAIQEAGRDLYNKLVNAHDYFDKLGKTLGNAVVNYNKLVGAIEGRGGAFFHARKLGNLVNDSDGLDMIEPMAAEPRLLSADDWKPEPVLALAAEGEEAPEAAG